MAKKVVYCPSCKSMDVDMVGSNYICQKCGKVFIMTAEDNWSLKGKKILIDDDGSMAYSYDEVQLLKLKIINDIMKYPNPMGFSEQIIRCVKKRFGDD